MVQFKVGDIVTICASLEEFCGVETQVYNIADINISLPPCSINIFPNSFTDCVANPLSPSGILLEFYWVSNTASASVHSCADSIKLKTLGSGYTDSDAKVVFTYAITGTGFQNDLDLFNANPDFDLMVCIKNKSASEVVNIGQSRNERRLGDPISIVSNICTGVICPKPICSGGSLYQPICDPPTGQCVADTTKLIISPCPTHYIEYNFSFLPQDFRDLIIGNITEISNRLGGYLTFLSNNIIYRKATYDSKSGEFRIYVDYTPSLGGTNNTNYVYNPLTQRIETLALIDTLESAGAIIGGIVLFIIGAILAVLVILGVITGGWVIVLGALLAAIGTIIVEYAIETIFTGEKWTGDIATHTPEERVVAVQEFIDTYLDPAANNLTPQCVCPTPTASCTVNDMLFYLGGRSTARLAQCIHAHANKGDSDELCSTTIKNEIDAIKNGLNDGTITVQQACDRLETNIVTPVKKDVNKVIEDIKCTGGYWSAQTKGCIFPNCWIKNPVGGCILSASTGKAILVLGGLTIGAVIVYNNVIKKR